MLCKDGLSYLACTCQCRLMQMLKSSAGGHRVTGSVLHLLGRFGCKFLFVAFARRCSLHRRELHRLLTVLWKALTACGYAL